MQHSVHDEFEQAAATSNVKILRVAAGLLLNEHGQLLLGQRPEGKSYAGWWEVPGGKLEPGETPNEALGRELHEELGVHITEFAPWVTHMHVYPQSIVRLSFFRVTGWQDEPRGMEGQQLKWVNPQLTVPQIEASLGSGHLLPATLPPLSWLKVPQVYVIVAPESAVQIPALLRHVAQAIANGARLFQFRAPAWPDGADASSLYDVFQQVHALTRAAKARLLVNSAHPEAWWHEAEGVHLRSAHLANPLPGLAPDAWIGASAHNAQELQQARKLGVLFSVLGPVLPTASHPDAPPMGWQQFAHLAEGAGMPVFALGGQSANTMETAIRHGAHGIAGIRHAAVACRIL